MRSRDASSISPRDFIQQNTTQDGEQIDVRIQQDATEFLAKLMQDVERMKSATDISAAKLIQRTFGCVLLQEIKSVNGKHKGDPREVPFYGYRSSSVKIGMISRTACGITWRRRRSSCGLWKVRPCCLL